MAGTEVRSPWDRHRVPCIVVGESMTEQSHAEACDINFIVSRFARSGHLPPAREEAVYADVTNYQGSLLDRLAWAQAVIAEAEEVARQAEAVSFGAGVVPTPPVAPTGSSEPV